MLSVGEGTCDGIIWSSSTPEIAEVDSEGILTAKKQGGTVITASSKNGTTTQCTVMITAPTISITKSKTLKINKSTTLSIKPENYRTRVKWTSSNKKIATVNQN